MKTQHGVRRQDVSIALPGATLAGELALPERSRSLVMFVHGSGSSRFSPRNKFVADMLNDAGCATLLFDLLTESEEKVDEVSGRLRFNIELLADRVLSATVWVRENQATQEMKIGYFGASTGAAAALVAAAEIPRAVHAVVSRGGRPDLAGSALYKVQTPTLLIVGGNDTYVLQLNREAEKALRCEKQLSIVKGASHLFEEPGTLETAAELARDWFTLHLGQD